MNIFNKTIKFLLLGSCALLVASCSDDDNWKPGSKIDPNSPQVYFSNDNPKTGMVAMDQEYLEIEISRVKTDGALIIPVNVNWSSDGLLFPDETVSFSAGQKTAIFRIGYDKDKLAYEIAYPFKLEIDVEYMADPYDSTIPGTPLFLGNLKREEPWMHVADATCTYEATSGTRPAVFDPFIQKLYKKRIAGLFKFENWCLNNTGEWYGDLIFSVDEKNQIHPDASIGYHGYSGRWFFYVPWATSDSDEFQIEGKLPTSTGVYMTYYYLYKVGSTDARFAMDFDEKEGTAKLGGYTRFSSSTFSSGSFLLHYEWTPNPELF